MCTLCCMRDAKHLIYLSNQVLSDAITDEEGIEDDGDEVWPFHSFVEQLILDMFDPGNPK